MIPRRKAAPSMPPRPPLPAMRTGRENPAETVACCAGSAGTLPGEERNPSWRASVLESRPQGKQEWSDAAGMGGEIPSSLPATELHGNGHDQSPTLVTRKQSGIGAAQSGDRNRRRFSRPDRPGRISKLGARLTNARPDGGRYQILTARTRRGRVSKARPAPWAYDPLVNCREV